MRALRFFVVTVLAVGSFVAGTVVSGDLAGAQSPRVTEYAGLSDSSVPLSMTLGPDGRVWYANFDNRVGAVSQNGVVTEYSMPRATLDITSGPSGALWAVGVEESVISRVTTGGVATDFTMPATGADPGGGGITAGPDGNVWYTRSPGVVGKMTPAGVFTEYAVPLPDPSFLSYPGSITAGADGALWFVERFSDGRIGRVTTDGQFTMYPIVSGSNGDLRDVVSGPDNNLWVINGENGQVGRVAPDGATSWFSLPAVDNDATPIALTAGPDGNLWAAGSPSLWKITTGGTVTQYAVGYFDFATGVAAGADGRVWYSRLGADGARMGAITVGNHPYGEFTSLTPSRVLDTREGIGRGGVRTPLGAGQSFDVQITGQGGVPLTGVSAVVLNVTATDTTAGSFLSVWPTGTPRPNVSNLNYGPGQIIANMSTVAVGQDGKLSAYNGAGSTHVIFDVVGYYSSANGPFGARFKPLTPARLFDTRNGQGGVPAAPIGANSSLSFRATGVGGVPSTGVTGVVMNVTVANSTMGGYLTVYPGDVSRPNASNINFPAGRSVPNLVTARVPANGFVNFYNAVGQAHVLADVVGYYTTSETSNEGRFVPLPPQRRLDTRTDLPGPVEQGVVAQMGGVAGLPYADIGAAVLNVTVTEASTGGFLTVFPDDLCQVPFASNLNFVPGQTVPNQVVTRLSPEILVNDCQIFPTGAVFFNAMGTVHVIVDVFGYFTNARFADHSQPTGSGLAGAFDEMRDIMSGTPADSVQPWTAP